MKVDIDIQRHEEMVLTPVLPKETWECFKGSYKEMFPFEAFSDSSAKAMCNKQCIHHIIPG